MKTIFGVLLLCLIVATCQEKSEDSPVVKDKKVAVDYDRFPADGANVSVRVFEIEVGTESGHLIGEVLALKARGRTAPGISKGTIIKIPFNREQMTRERVINARPNDTLELTIIHSGRPRLPDDSLNTSWNFFSIN